MNRCQLYGRATGFLTLALCVLSGIGIVVPKPALSHEFWLSPSLYRASAGLSVEIQACVGTGFRGETLPYSPARTVRFEVFSPEKRDLQASALNGDPFYARVALHDSVGAIVTYLSNFTQIELPAVEFDHYLALEGLNDVLAARKQSEAPSPGRERYRRCAKCWISGTDASIVTRAYGLPFEIVPMSDPSVPAAGLTVRVLWEGRPSAGTLVRAWRQPLDREFSLLDPTLRDSIGPATESRSDDDGIAHLRVDRAGEWLLSAVHMTSARRSRSLAGDENPPNVDWESSWASLTFLRRQEVP
jgi:uncharacterized GH25 family protein